MLPSSSLRATTVNAISGGLLYNGNYYGYSDGNTFNQAMYHTPTALAFDSTGQYLFLADRDNNAVRFLDLSGGLTWTFVTNQISKPVGVAVDPDYNVYVLNRGSGTNGTVLTFDNFGDLVFTNASKLTNAAGMAMDTTGNIYLTVNSNNLVRIAAGTANMTTIATINIVGTSLQGIVVKHNGLIAACDSGRNGIYLIDPTTGIYTTNAGFNGAGDFLTNSGEFSSIAAAKFNQPMGVCETGDGKLVVTDNGNNRVKVISSGVVSNLYGVTSQYWTANYYPGWSDGTVKIPDSATGNVQARLPYGIAMGYDGTVYTTEDYYHLIRKVTGSGLMAPPPPPPGAPLNLTATTNSGSIVLSWSASTGATNYNVKRSTSPGGPFTIITNTSATSYTDSTVLKGTTYYYVVSALNTGGEGPNSGVVSAFLPLPPVPDPQIGYVDFPATSVPVAYTSVFHPVSSAVLNNDAYIVIEQSDPTAQIFYTIGTTMTNQSGTVTNPPDPNSSSGSAPTGYKDGSDAPTTAAHSVGQAFPDVTVKAIGEKQDGSPNSAIVSARFQYVTGNPTVIGGNAALFTVGDITAGAQVFYTLDGSDPSSTNASAVNLGVSQNSSNTWSISFSLQTNTLFKARAFRANYQASGIVSNVFLVSNFQPTTISFGFANGEGSSAFIASAGQTFYAPITLGLVGSPTMYSLQFNLVVTNGPVNSGPAIPPGTFGFESLLEKPIPGVTPTVYEYIPPAMFVGLLTVPNPVMLDGSTDFSSLLTTNTGLNLLGIGWVERAGQTNLYNTLGQTLITFSQAHDTQFISSGGQVIVGGFNIQIPTTAQINQTYQIQIGRPSATSDGIGGSGSDVFISAPTNAGTGSGTVNALKYITVGQFKYVVGSTYPFRWYNAGDFGSSNIVSADVEQVFEAAVYQLNSPAIQAPGSDFFDTMDSSGNMGSLDANPADANNGYYTNSQTAIASVNPLFGGNDTTINQDIFGDGFLDVSDVYVTFRRSLDPSLTWYRRFWNNGQRVADIGANVANHSANITGNSGGTVSSKTQSGTTSPQVNFTAGDIIGSAGSTVQIPISATILGNYPLRVLMLNLTVTPLDGSPALTTPVSFTQTATVLGTPYTSDSKGNGNYSAVWLNSTNTGLTGTAVIGTLNVTIPASATTNAAYAVHFDHASGSPNGLASFAKTTLTGVLTTSSRTNSSYGDGIPDSWRLRWFGTINNILSCSNACPSGDNVNNWKKFIAGVDPSAANDFPKVNSKSSVPSGYNSAIHWPTVNGKKYVIQRASTLFSTPWSVLSTNVGTGADMEYDDNATNKIRFYRVLILP